MSSPANKLLRLIGDFREGEFRRAAFLHSQFALVVFALLLGRTVRDGLYLSRTGVKGLPWLYVGVAVFSTTATLIYARALGKGRPLRIGPWVQAVLAGSFVLFAFLVQSGSDPVYAALYLWVEVLTTISVVQFWNVANEQFHPRQAKRLYGFIASGQAIGNLLCGVIASGVGTYYSVEVLISVVAVVCLLVGLMYAIQRPGETVTEAKQSSASSNSDMRPATLFRRYRSYITAILFLVAITYLATSWVDFQFKVIAKRHHDEASLVRFFGQFYGAVGVFSFVFQFFLLRYVTHWIGLFGALMLMPLMFTGLGAFLPVIPALWLSTTLKFSENGLRYAIYDPLLQTLFLPLPTGVRARVQSMASGMVKPMAMGLAGLLLVPLAPDQPGGIAAEWIGVAVSVASAVLLFLLWRLRRGYLRVLADDTADVVEQRTRRRVRVTEPGATQRIEQLVRSGGEAAVAWVLDRVEVADAAAWKEILRTAVERDDLPLMQRAELTLRLTELGERVDVDPESGRRDWLLESIAGVASGRTGWKTIQPYLQAPEVEIREAAVWYLFSTGKPEATLAAREALVLAAEGDLEDRRMALRLLDFASEEERHTLIGAALASEEPALIEEALRALAKHPDETFLAEVVAALGRREVRTVALQALAAAGPAGLDHLQQGAGDQPPWRRLGRQWEAYARLADTLDWSQLAPRLVEEEPDSAYWPAAWIAVARTDGRAPSKSVVDRVRSQVRAWAAVRRTLAEASDGSVPTILERAATDRLNGATVTAVAAAFVEHPPPVERWPRLLRRDLWDNATLRANLAEIVESSVPRPLRDEVIAILEQQLARETPDPNVFVPLPAPLPQLAAQQWDELRVESSDRTGEADVEELIERVLFLSSVPLFKNLAGEDLEQIAEILEERRYQADEAIIRQGEQGDSLYLITGGKVRVHLAEQTLAELEPGAVVGEMALLDDQPRSADVTAMDEVTVLRLDRGDFEHVLQAFPQIARGIMRVLTERLRRANAA